MQTYETPYNTPTDRERYNALQTPKGRAQKEKLSQTNSPFSAFAALELWDCEHSSLFAGETRLFRVRFTRGHSIRLRAWAKDGIGISVQDMQGHTVVQDRHEAGRANATVRPESSGEYLVTLVNTADHEAHYVLYIADETVPVA